MAASPIGFIGVIWFLCGVLSFGGFLFLRNLYRRRASGPPGCGTCGYPVQGLTEWKCPECGADLQAVGTTQPGKGPPRVQLHMLSLLLAVPGAAFVGGLLLLVLRLVLTLFWG